MATKFHGSCAEGVFLNVMTELMVTLPETNIAPENGSLEYSFPFGMAYFQGLC